MLLRVCRILAIAALALQLGACIYSDYDISSSLNPEFPVKPGTYAKAGGGAVVVVRRTGDAYQIYNRSTKLTTYARAFKIPEYPDYVMQYYDRKGKPIVYLFLKTTEKGFDVYTIDKLAASVPEQIGRAHV